jgi:hypothetical protein
MPRNVVASVAIVFAVVIVGWAAPASAGDKQKPKAAPIILTGCLQTDGARYILTDLLGVDVPPSIRVVGAAPAMTLKDHVAQQVTITGVSSGAALVKARSVRQLKSSCSS